MWRGIPVRFLADAPWPARRRLLAALLVECAEAAVRNRQLLAARVVTVEPDPPDVVEARIRANGWNVESVAEGRARRRDRIRELRAGSQERRAHDAETARRYQQRQAAP